MELSERPVGELAGAQGSWRVHPGLEQAGPITAGWPQAHMVEPAGTWGTPWPRALKRSCQDSSASCLPSTSTHSLLCLSGGGFWASLHTPALMDCSGSWPALLWVALSWGRAIISPLEHTSKKALPPGTKCTLFPSRQSSERARSSLSFPISASL